MERIGEFVVLSYHDVRDAATLHEQFKRRAIDAAVIDSAYIMSRLHLVVALHRITRLSFAIDANGETAAAATAAKRSPPTPRDVFSALSHTRNLDRVLQRLTCAETTKAVVIVLIAPSAEHIAAVVEIVKGVQHELSSLAAYCDEAAVRDFYGVGSTEAAALDVAVVNRLVTSDI
ncbi:hypothetical protein DQ04_05151030 [Trypanosoma grayi]|uniref:hypothetical protein n=1 Tax=Trypanosoma grayi TaxID=71804 RepID=UPI0004F45C6E|nr:hypothetical protein DQ04_05151030 [Trypanosoma grayi]KEG09478.1 hypothetical protein DQ04_05151030 [Trypanosoma grayi]